uniref:NADH-ubiquinone oxidoreductase chain 2 n=1 Tax=Magnusiomyces capitatus TaxID=1095183 RepID=A0A023UPR9_9ASCO|nr:NADH dehydrogenase subunit 2 [Magnusiomyces capitatus]AHY04957.1 NADH dehydrogenase subunit 2 [Magnusiomyces capitatus]
MLVLGTLILILSTFNLKTMKEVKEIYRMGMMLLMQMMVMLYDSMHLDFMNNGLSMYNDMFMVTSYTKLMEVLMFIMAMVYLYIMKEYTYNVNTMNKDNTLDNLKVNLFGNNPAKMLRGPMELIILMTLNLFGMMLFMQWNNIMVMFVTLELQSYTLYLITTMFNKSYNSTKSGLYYFLLGSVGSMFVLLGFTILYSETGLVNMSDIYQMYNNNTLLNNNIIFLSYLFILMGLFFKMGTAPFHNWLINIYANTPTMITIWMSIIAKMSMLTVIYTLISNSSFIYNNNYVNLLSSNYIVYNIPLFLATISIISIMFGAMGGLGQFTIKRIIGYSGLVNSGYFMFVMLSNNNSTLSTYLFNIYQYSLTHMVWFVLMLVNGLYYSNTKTLNQLYTNNLRPRSSINVPMEFVKDLYGYLFINPYLGFSYMVVLSSLIGIPPTTGFYAKYYVLLTGMNSSYLFMGMLVLLSSAMTIYYYIFIVKNLMVTDTNNNMKIINIWKNMYNKNYQNIKMTPMLSMVMSIIIMMMMSMTVGLDMANNGTHMVEYYYMNK